MFTLSEITHVSAVTLKISDMRKSVAFYRDILGLKVKYGGESSSFVSFRIGNSYLNLERSDSVATGWGRIVFYCDNVDEIYSKLKQKGFSPPKPENASWGERFFHIKDPDGHELSIARPLQGELVR